VPLLLKSSKTQEAEAQNLEYLNLRISMDRVNIKVVVILLAIITFLLLLKVYISNKIYRVSREIQKTTIKINALKEEQNILKLKIEKLKYKNTIADPLFNYKLEKKDEAGESN
jgi:cell division protein FtsL